MICISIAQESRRFALADMYNAASQCDLLELRLDRFQKAPEVGDMISAAPKPVIFSCRRKQDGGEWAGSEDERLALLRHCIVSKADYVEIELDVADQIRRFPPAKRVISYTNLQETPADLAEIYAEAQNKHADVIKLVTRVRTPEEGWPLVQILAKPALPTVGIGLGRAAVMLAILGKKIGAPWTYAALEKGMEAYPGQPTVSDLNDIYHYGTVARATPLFGVTGFGERERAMAAGLNASFKHLGYPDRCLPLEVGNARLFRKIIAAVRLTGVAVDPDHQEALLAIADHADDDARRAGAADLLLHRQEAWQGSYLLGQAGIAALQEALSEHYAGERPLAGRHALIIGANPAARAVAAGIQKAGALPIIASRDREAAHRLAQAVDGRFILFEALYSTMHEVLAVCSEERQPGARKTHAAEPPIHPAHLQANLTVLDLTSMPRRSPLLRAAKERGCRVVSPWQVLLLHLLLMVRQATGREIPAEPIKQAITEVFDEDDEA
jgi:3-dehydroquinate dehydratase/shikimate dehydrogenase